MPRRHHRPNASASQHSIQSTLDRFGWVFVLLMLLAAVGTIAGAAYQAQSTRSEYAKRDAVTARDSSRSVRTYLDRRLAEQSLFLTNNADVFKPGRVQQLQGRINKVYLAYSLDYVIGVVVTDADGEVVLASQRIDGMFDSDGTIDDLAAVGRSAAGRGVPVVSGALTLAGRSVYAQASPLSGLSPEYGSWVVLYDTKASPLGNFFHAPPRRGQLKHPTVFDDRGHALLGGQPRHAATNGHSTAQARVTGTSWRVVVPRATPPRGVPTWLFVVLFVGLTLLGGFYWLQEGTRRTLQSESQLRAGEVRRLYSLASDLLHSDSAREQATHLARALHESTSVDAVRVVIALDRDAHGVVEGVIPARARSYRLAITGTARPLGELVLYSAHERVSDDIRATARTMSTIAGAAMHTLTVLERERHAAEELQRVDELRTNLLSTVAHELRSPLTAIKGVLSLLAMQSDLPDKSRQYVGVATERTDALVALIRDLFDCSLLESGQLQVSTERVLATDILNKALGALATSRPGEVILSATPNLMITTDPLRFDQIVNNLVTNAFRHGAAPIEVMVRPYRDGACLIVTDSGPGIPQIERSRIFSKFYQSDSGHARLVEGAGLGLALVHGLVQLHGGRIEVDSVRIDGSGARFTIFLPDVAPDPRLNDPRTASRDEFTGSAIDTPPEESIEVLRDIV